MSVEDRFWAKVDATSPDGCWPWTAAVSKNGYGNLAGLSAHRVSYELNVGSIPEGLQIDHLCRNTRCVRPDHLEPVTGLENMRRRYAYVTHCKRGHEYTPENTYRKPDGCRDCRACIRRRTADYKARSAA